MRAKIPPPIVLLITGAAMWLVARSELARPVSVPYPLAMSLVLVAAGVLVIVLAMRQFGAAETTVNPLTPESATALVSNGVFRLSRNPMYFGLLLILMGWGLWLGSLTNVIVVFLFVLLITELQIKPEENALRALFGEEYDQYCSQVRRWI